MSEDTLWKSFFPPLYAMGSGLELRSAALAANNFTSRAMSVPSNLLSEIRSFTKLGTHQLTWHCTVRFQDLLVSAPRPCAGMQVYTSTTSLHGGAGNVNSGLCLCSGLLTTQRLPPWPVYRDQCFGFHFCSIISPETFFLFRPQLSGHRLSL